MAKFTFNSLNIGNLNTGSYYAVVVNNPPLPSNTTRADIASSIVGSSVTLTNRSLTSTKWTFDGFQFPTTTYGTSIYGVVILFSINGTPGTPNANDVPIVYSSFVNSINQDLIIPPGTYIIPVDFGVDGTIKFIPMYQYSTGAYVDPGSAGFYNGLFYLIGTKNNTVAFSDPANGAYFDLWFASSTQFSFAYWVTDRSTANGPAISGVGVTPNFAIDFKTNLVRLDSIIHRLNVSAGSGNVQVFASNYLTNGYTQNGILNSTDWTNISSFVSAGTNWGNAASSDTTTFWRYLKFQLVSGVTHQTFTEIELRGTILSLTQNLV